MITQLAHKLTTLALVFCALALLGLPALAQDFPNDIRPGSVLFFNRYTSSASNPSAEDTQINITNTDPSRTIDVHLFLVDGSSCSVADSIITLTGSQTTCFLTSDLDPGTKGYIVAVATAGGFPTQFNFLLGTAYIRESDGRLADLPAVTIRKTQPGTVSDPGDGVANMVFDGGATANSYDKLPGTVAISAFNSQTTDSTIFALYSPAANLLTGENPSISIFALMFNQLEVSRSLTFRIGCYTTTALTSLRVLNGLNTFIPRGSCGWMKMNATNGRPLLGMVQSKGPIFNGGRNLSVLTLAPAYTITVPAF
ncbi:MAG TPA: hypothetical protein VFD58_35865 [Blastocatellia bacterium]|nr:hypothetical protein [Blastocatellia bacterium]